MAKRLRCSLTTSTLLYSETMGNETAVVRTHSGNGPHEEMDELAIACFDEALTMSASLLMIRFDRCSTTISLGRRTDRWREITTRLTTSPMVSGSRSGPGEGSSPTHRCRFANLLGGECCSEAFKKLRPFWWHGRLRRCSEAEYFGEVQSIAA